MVSPCKLTVFITKIGIKFFLFCRNFQDKSKSSLPNANSRPGLPVMPIIPGDQTGLMVGCFLFTIEFLNKILLSRRFQNGIELQW